MRAHAKFGVAEAVVLLTMSAMARIFLTFPQYLIETAGPAAWLSSLAGLVFALFQVYLFYLLLKPHPDQSIVEITGEALGRYAGTAVNIIFCLYFVLVAVFFARPFSEAMLISALPGTPISVVNTSFILAGLFGAYLGLEALARAARIAYPFMLGGIVVLLLGLSPQWDISGIYPILGTGPVKVILEAGLNSSLVSEVLIAGVIVQSFHGPGMFGRVVSRAMVMAFLYLAVLEMILVMTVTWNVAVEYTLPFYNISRLIFLSRFFQRIESIFVIIWGFIGMIKVALALYAAAVTLAGALRLPDHRPLLPALAMITFTASLLPPDFPSTLEFDAEIARKYIVPAVTIFLPAVVLAADHLRRRGRGNEGG